MKQMDGIDQNGKYGMNKRKRKKETAPYFSKIFLEDSYISQIQSVQETYQLSSDPSKWVRETQQYIF